MKIKLGLMISMVGLFMLFGVVLAQAQQTPAASTRSAPARTPQPSIASTPGTQSAPSVPDVPSVPSLPNVPSVHGVPNVPDADPLGDVLFPPDLIMRHARELGLTDEQKAFMRSEIQRTTSRFNELQWQLQDAMEVLHQTMESTSVNDQQALSQLDKVLDVEREIKHLHVGLGIRLKNHLTPEQQAKLQGMRRAPWPDAQPRPPE